MTSFQLQNDLGRECQSEVQPKVVGHHAIIKGLMQCQQVSCIATSGSAVAVTPRHITRHDPWLQKYVFGCFVLRVHDRDRGHPSSVPHLLLCIPGLQFPV